MGLKELKHPGVGSLCVAGSRHSKDVPQGLYRFICWALFLWILAFKLPLQLQWSQVKRACFSSSQLAALV